MQFCAETLLMSFVQLPVMMFYAVKPENATKLYNSRCNHAHALFRVYMCGGPTMDKIDFFHSS